jgi:hypothetical protein
MRTNITLKDGMKTLPEDFLRDVQKQVLSSEFLESKAVKTLGQEIVQDAIQKHSAYQIHSLSHADVMLRMNNGTVQKVEWKRVYQARGNNGTDSLTGHGKRFLDACDGK